MTPQLVPVTIKMVLALPDEWPKPDNGHFDYRGPLARAFYDDLIDKLMDFAPRWTKKWREDSEQFVEHSQQYEGEVESIEIEAGDNGEWGYASQTIEDALREIGIYWATIDGAPTLVCRSRGEQERREPMVSAEDREGIAS